VSLKCLMTRAIQIFKLLIGLSRLSSSTSIFIGSRMAFESGPSLSNKSTLVLISKMFYQITRLFIIIRATEAFMSS
jgi:hypothetical protein